MVIPPSSRGGRFVVAQKRLRHRLSGRGPVIAGQAAIVAVLIAIVYGTFLQGTDSGPLSSIDAPGPQAQVGGNDDGDGEGGDGPGDAGSGGGAGGSGGVGGASTGGVGGAGAGTGTGGFVTTPGPPTSPPDNQYLDSLALLKRQLGLGAELSDGRLRGR